MEPIEIAGTDIVSSRIGLGTWAIGGWMWGGTDEAESICTIRAAIDRGITLIDTARSTDSASPKKSWEELSRNMGLGAESSLRPRSAWSGRTGRFTAMPRRSAYGSRSRIRSGGYERAISISTKCLARPPRSPGGNRRCHAPTARTGYDSRDWSQQLFARTNGTLPCSRTVACGAAAL